MASKTTRFDFPNNAALEELSFLSVALSWQTSIETLFAELDSHRNSICQEWTKYTSTISSPQMAVSLDSSAVLKMLVLKQAPKIILDLGSGFSSLLLRQSIKTAAGKVISIDDNRWWLWRTKRYLKQHVPESCEVMHLSRFLKNLVKAPFVFYDLGRMATREQYLELAWSVTDSPGLLFLDDIHKPRYYEQVESFIAEKKSRLIVLRALTMDNYGRFSGLVLKDVA